MREKQILFRPQFTLDQTKALHKILTNYVVKGEDLQEAMVIERLQESIIRFLSIHNADTREQVKHQLKEEAFENFDWSSVEVAGPVASREDLLKAGYTLEQIKTMGL